MKALIFVNLLLFPFLLSAQTPIADALKTQRADLHYPHSVERFYITEGSRLMWVLKDTVKTPVWDAMLLLDCVAQYGLSSADKLYWKKY